MRDFIDLVLLLFYSLETILCYVLVAPIKDNFFCQCHSSLSLQKVIY